MKSKASKQNSKNRLKSLPNPTEKIEGVSKLGLFDHVKHIRCEQTPNYYRDLSEENKKTFDHFMLLRALSMDNEVVQEMAFLYRYFNVIPSPQFYRLLISLIPKNNNWVPWIKTKVIKHSSEMLTAMSNYYRISKRQANEYINVLLSSDEGKDRLVDICLSIGFNEKEVEKLIKI